MKLIGIPRLEEFRVRHADVRTQLNAWIAEVEEAQWETPGDVKARYPHASIIGNDRVVFNLKGNRYRLDVKVNYKSQIVLVKHIGTHEQYEKWTF